MPDVLRAEDKRVVRDGRPILAEVSLTVRTGEHWAPLGANGAGNRPCRACSGRGSTRPAGRWRCSAAGWAGSTYGSCGPTWVTSTSRHPLAEPLRVREVVLTGLTGLTNSVALLPRWRPTPEQEVRADRLVRTMGPAELRDARRPTLSEAQRGRTLIARALMPPPTTESRLLLLDEPATGLDLPGRERLLDSLDSLRREHPQPATVLVTHHPEELPAGTTHALLLRDGRWSVRIRSGPRS